MTYVGDNYAAQHYTVDLRVPPGAEMRLESVHADVVRFEPGGTLAFYDLMRVKSDSVVAIDGYLTTVRLITAYAPGGWTSTWTVVHASDCGLCDARGRDE